MRILIVDNEVKLTMSLKRWLKDFGFRVSVAQDGVSAQEMVALGGINLVLLDSTLPDMSGYALCREIRANDPRIPIIMLSAHNTLDRKLEGFAAGSDDFIVKPFEFRELLARVKASIKRSYQTYDEAFAEVTQLSIADLTLDLRKKTVSRAGNKQISVTPREFMLLEYFMRHPGTVLTREEIARNVWDAPIDAGANLLNVYMNSLRKKIDRDFDTKLIHTRKGIGFVMRAYGDA